MVHGQATEYFGHDQRENTTVKTTARDENGIIEVIVLTRILRKFKPLASPKNSQTSTYCAKCYENSLFNLYRVINGNGTISNGQMNKSGGECFNIVGHKPVDN